MYWNMSAVNGLNVNATMTLEGPGCTSSNCGCDKTIPKVIKTNMAAYNGRNDGCPYIASDAQDVNSILCVSPQHYPASISGTAQRPAWVTGTDNFTTADVGTDAAYSPIWSGVDDGEKTAVKMAEAGSGLANNKKGYHIWWSTNPVALGWLDYLQNNASGRCDAYGWPYDEKKWKPGDTFDINGDPPANPLGVLVHCPAFTSDRYLNIDILDIM